jgi:hypothetical protein
MAKNQRNDRTENKGRDQKKGRDSHREEGRQKETSQRKQAPTPVTAPPQRTNNFSEVVEKTYPRMVALATSGPFAELAREQTGKGLANGLRNLCEKVSQGRIKGVTFSKDTLGGLLELVAWRRPVMRGKGDREELDILFSRILESFEWAREDDSSTGVLGFLTEALG